MSVVQLFSKILHYVFAQFGKNRREDVLHSVINDSKHHNYPSFVYLFWENNTSFTFLRHEERAPYANAKVCGLFSVLFYFIVILHIIVDSLKTCWFLVRYLTLNDCSPWWMKLDQEMSLFKWIQTLTLSTLLGRLRSSSSVICVL